MIRRNTIKTGRAAERNDMKQIVQPTGGGPVLVVDAPRPTVGANEVLVRTSSTLI